MLKVTIGLCMLLAGCAIEDVDAVGTWQFTAKFGAGTCFTVGDTYPLGAIRVTGGPGAYQCQNASGLPGITTACNIACETGGCAMSASETTASTGQVYMWSLMLGVDDAITGSGNTTGTNPTCSQSLIDVMGSRS